MRQKLTGFTERNVLVRTYGRMDGRTDGWTDGRAGGRMDGGWMDGPQTDPESILNRPAPIPNRPRIDPKSTPNRAQI